MQISDGKELHDHIQKDQLNLERSNNVHNRDGRRFWGFWGMEPVVKLYV